MGMFDFMANEPGSHEAMLLRQKMAYALMQHNRGYPKNIGEGLTEVGRSLGDIGMMRRLEASQAALDASSARKAAAVRPPANAAPVIPQPNPGAGAEATPSVSTADAGPWGGAVDLPPPQATASGSPFPDVAAPPVAAAEASPSLPPEGIPTRLASAVSSDTMSDADPLPATLPAPTAPPDPALRSRVAQTLQARQGVPQQNPMLAGQSPASLPSTLDVDPSLLGSPPDLNNRPIELPIQLAQAGTKPAPPPPQLPPDSAMPPAVPPAYAPAQPVPPAPAEPRVAPSKNLTAKEFQYQPPPAPPPMSPMHLNALQALRTETFPRDRAMYEQVIKEEEGKRADQHALNMKNWEAKQRMIEAEAQAEQAFRRGTPQRNLELKEKEEAQQKRAYEEVISRQIGGIPPADYAATLKANKEVLSGIPSANDSVRRARKILDSDKLFVGTATADTEKFLSKLMGSAGFPVDPKVSGTEQFKQAMAGILGQARKSIIGPGAQSDRELATLESAIASDVKLDPATIRAALDAAESLNFKLSHAHMQMVRPFAGETDPDRQRSIYSVYGAPDYINSIPEAAVRRLRQDANDPAAHKEFDDAFHMPGLSREVLRLRRP